MEITISDITSIEIKTIPNTSRKGTNWIKVVLTDVHGHEHDIAIFPPHLGPDTIITQRKRKPGG